MSSRSRLHPTPWRVREDYRVDWEPGGSSPSRHRRRRPASRLSTFARRIDERAKTRASSWKTASARSWRTNSSPRWRARSHQGRRGTRLTRNMNADHRPSPCRAASRSASLGPVRQSEKCVPSMPSGPASRLLDRDNPARTARRAEKRHQGHDPGYRAAARGDHRERWPGARTTAAGMASSWSRTRGGGSAADAGQALGDVGRESRRRSTCRCSRRERLVLQPKPDCPRSSPGREFVGIDEPVQAGPVRGWRSSSTWTCS